MKFESILDSIGDTPLVRLKGSERNGKGGNGKGGNGKVPVYAKLERWNPGGSVKDRIALAMIEAAEESGELTKDKIILEPTSGNTGIGLALVAAAKGYRLTLVMPESMSIERRKMIGAYGAEIVLTPAEERTDGAIQKAHEMAKDEKYFMPEQFSNVNNPKIHYKATAEEILKDTNGEVTHFVAGMGTGGTLMGVSRNLKEHNPGIKIVGVEPVPGHKLQGMKNMATEMKPSIYNEKEVDEVVQVEDKLAHEASRRLAREEGILVGMSSGAAAHVALEYAKRLDKGLVIVVFPDGGEKYLSTALFEPPADACPRIL